MRDISYYQMRAFLYPRENELSVEFKLEELERIWICTRKNVKRKLKKFHDEQFVIYQPGKGRGNHSTLVFHRSLQVEIEEAVQEAIDRNQLEDLIALLHLSIPKSWITYVSKEIRELFGIHSFDESKDVLRTIITREMTTLDPLYCSITLESILINLLGDPLVSYNKKTDTVEPHIAHHWIVDNEYTTWTFYLRKAVRFHHQGILTSEDVKYTFERFQQPDAPLHWFVEDIRSIECPSKYAVRFKLNKSNPFFLRYLSAGNLVILPKDVPFDENRWIGSGPFKLKERTENKLIIEANDYYFLERPLLDEIEFWRVPEETTKAATYYVDGVDGKEVSESLNQQQDVEIGIRFLAFNFYKKRIVQHPSFRKAIFHLLDMKELYKALGRVDLIEASSFFPWKSKPYKKDRSLVQQYLKEAGYRGETLTIYSLDNLKGMEVTNWFMKEAAYEGIHFQLKTYDLNYLYTRSHHEDVDLIFGAEVAASDIHLSFLGAFYNKSLYFRQFLGPEHLAQIETWLERMKLETDSKKREFWMDKVEAYLRNEHLILFLNHPVKNKVFHPMIRDIQYESYGYVDFRKLWIQ